VSQSLSSSRGVSSAVSVAELRELARRRLPRMVFDWMDGGAETESTLAANESAFRQLEFDPRVLVDVSAVDTSVEIFGTTISAPIVLGPVGLQRLLHRDGEVGSARAAASRGVPFALSCQGSVSIEDVATQAPDTTRWFQSHIFRDRGLAAEVLRRAEDAGYSVLLVTADVPTVGKRERDLRHGLQIPPSFHGRARLDALCRPRWSWDFWRDDVVTFASFEDGFSGCAPGSVNLGERSSSQMQLSPSWKDVEWFRSRWSGPVVVKGILSATDAQRAMAEGADGFVVSNHGGRQLDGAPATLSVLSEVVEAVPEAEVFIDGGIRRGSDVVKALALGARACLLGRAYVFGLGAGGQAGVTRAIDILLEEMRRTMILTGVPVARDIDATIVRR
jgi:L-lactate dehydrogenase (cytochrome)